MSGNVSAADRRYGEKGGGKRVEKKNLQQTAA